MSDDALTSRTRVPHALEVVLNGPVGPQRLREDTVVIDADGWYRTITPAAAFSTLNDILFCRLDRHNTERQVDAIIAEYHDRGLPLTWSVYPWTQPANLGELLLARGAAAMNVRAYLGSTSLPLEVVDGVEVERVDPNVPGAFDAFFDILASGYSMSADEEAFRRSRYRQLSSGTDPVMQLHVARCDGEYAGCAGVMIKEDSAHLTTASVLPAFQGRGVLQSLTASQLTALRDLDIPIADGHANDLSAFWIQRFGFDLIFAYRIYEMKPPNQK